MSPIHVVLFCSVIVVVAGEACECTHKSIAKEMEDLKHFLNILVEKKPPSDTAVDLVLPGEISPLAMCNCGAKETRIKRKIHEIPHEPRHELHHDPRHEVHHEPHHEPRHEVHNEPHHEPRHEPHHEPRYPLIRKPFPKRTVHGSFYNGRLKCAAGYRWIPVVNLCVNN